MCDDLAGIWDRVDLKLYILGTRLHPLQWRIHSHSTDASAGQWGGERSLWPPSPAAGLASRGQRDTIKWL